MGAAVSTALPAFEGRRRTSRESRGSRTSILRNSNNIAESTQQDNATPAQRLLSKPPTSVPPPPQQQQQQPQETTDSAAMHRISTSAPMVFSMTAFASVDAIGADAAARKVSTSVASANNIIPKDRTNSCTVNSVHVAGWDGGVNAPATQKGGEERAPVALTAVAASSTARTSLNTATAMDVEKASAEVQGAHTPPDSDANFAAAAAATTTAAAAAAGDGASSGPLSRGWARVSTAAPSAVPPRSLRWAANFSPLLPEASAGAQPRWTPTRAPSSEFCPWELQRGGSVSSADFSDPSAAGRPAKAHPAPPLRATPPQRLSEDSRSRGNSTSVSKDARSVSLGRRGSRGQQQQQRRPDSTQLSTEEWSRLLETMATGNALICVDGSDSKGDTDGKKKGEAAEEVDNDNDENGIVDTQLSIERSAKVASLPQYAPTDVRATPTMAPVSNSSTNPEESHFTPLRMRFSTTASVLCDPSYPEQDLERAMSSVDAYAANMRRLLASWQDICTHHLDRFAQEMAAALLAKNSSSSSEGNNNNNNNSTTSGSGGGGHVLTAALAEEQAMVTLRMLGQAVPLVTQMEDLVPVLHEMGAMHRRHDVLGGRFEALHQAFMEVLPRYVGRGERRTLCDAIWEPFWQIVVSLLTQGATSARGDWHAAQRRAEWMAEARAVLQAVATQQQATPYRGTFACAMLDRAEAANPAMAQFFLLREPRTAIRAFEGIVLVALELTEEAERKRYVEQLAHEHILYGFTEWGVRALRQPFIDTAQHYARLSATPETWTDTAATSLGLFWDVVTEYWVGGLALSRQSLTDIRRLSAPSGSRPFCMLFTDVEAGARLWEVNPTAMADAMDAYTRLVRTLITENGAYEVKTDGDAFVVATKDAFTALQMAVSLQLELMRRPITEDFQMVPVVQGGGLASCWRSDSLRVRVGIHYCTDASAVYDSVQRRFDYYGPSVNCAARTAAAAAGGQILMTQDAVRALRTSGSDGAADAEGEDTAEVPIAEIPPGTNPMDAVLDNLLEFQWWGEQRFRGISEAVGLYSVLPMRLTGRTFPYYVGNRKVRVSAPSDLDGRKEVHRLSLAQLKSGRLNDLGMSLFRSQ